MIQRRSFLLGVNAVAASALLAACGRKTGAQVLRVGLVAKSLGNNFFNAVRKGADEAAAELKNVSLIFTGPTSPTAEGQIEVINALIAQQVDAIAVSANDPDALVPSLQRAKDRGIKVVSYDSAVAPAGRIVHLAASSDALIGQTCVDLAAAAAPGGKGKIAIVSATATSTNQNMWIAEMRRALPHAPGLNLVEVVYGDDVADKSYRETVTLLRRNPDLSVIVAPSSVAIVAAAKAIEDQGAVGRVFVTGLGLPSEVEGHVKAGSVKSFALWNPIDLGYATMELAVQLARGADIGPGRSATLGRIGVVQFDSAGIAPMGRPFVFDAGNIDRFAKIF
jgi:rhamnose transport system substrate-binding protein